MCGRWETFESVELRRVQEIGVRSVADFLHTHNKNFLQA